MTDKPTSSAQVRLRELLRETRLAAGLKQSDVAARLGCHQSYIAKSESSSSGRRLEIVEFIRLVRAMGGDPCDIIRQVMDADDATELDQT